MHISFNNTKFGFSFFIETNKDANNDKAFLSYILNRHPTKDLKAVDSYNLLYTTWCTIEVFQPAKYYYKDELLKLTSTVMLQLFWYIKCKTPIGDSIRKDG